MRTHAQLTIAEDLSVGDWIREGLDSWDSQPFSVGICIPGGFDSYVFIRHSGAEGGLNEDGSTSLTALLDTLAEFTKTPEDCFQALWEGYGWLHQGAIAIYLKREPLIISPIMQLQPLRYLRMWSTMRKHRHRDLSKSVLLENTLPKGIMESERFQLPNRNYLLMRGAIKEAQKIGFEINDHFHFESPNLIWPEDRSWIFVEELDFNATLIGGSQELIQKVSLMNELNSRIFHRTETAVDLGINNW